jgi:hypothetical protein
VKRELEFAQQALDVVTINSNRAPIGWRSLLCAILPGFSPAEIPHDEHAKWNFGVRSS